MSIKIKTNVSPRWETVDLDAVAAGCVEYYEFDEGFEFTLMDAGASQEKATYRVDRSWGGVVVPVREKD